MTMATLLAALAAGLAAIGLFGTVALRRCPADSGDRRAPGARRACRRRAAAGLGQAVALTLLGAVIGLGIALPAGELLRPLLFGAAPPRVGDIRRSYRAARRGVRGGEPCSLPGGRRGSTRWRRSASPSDRDILVDSRPECSASAWREKALGLRGGVLPSQPGHRAFRCPVRSGCVGDFSSSGASTACGNTTSAVSNGRPTSIGSGSSGARLPTRSLTTSTGCRRAWSPLGSTGMNERASLPTVGRRPSIPCPLARLGERLLVS